MPDRSRLRLFSRYELLAGAFAVASMALMGCQSVIGDGCVLSTDCSFRGDRLCDTSQPGGYCTQFPCRGNLCPDEASCVLFNSRIPGCGFDDRAGSTGSRSARQFCVASCNTNDDCRPGYVCADPRTPPWNALILDDNQTKRTCLVIPAEAATTAPSATAKVCGPSAPSAPPLEAGAPKIVVDAGADAPPFVVLDAGASDAAPDAADAATDAPDAG